MLGFEPSMSHYKGRGGTSMNSKWFWAAMAAVVLVCVTSPVVSGAEPVYKDIHGNWVTFDHEVNWGYDPDRPHLVVKHPYLDSGVTFNVTFQDVADGNNFGFDCPVDGATRQARVWDALAYLTTVLAGESGQADIHFPESVDIPGAYLAVGGSLYPVSPNGFYNGAVFEYITTGTKMFPGYPDGYVTFNFNYDYYAGTGTPGASQFDFWSIVLHEVTHALGFASLVSSDGLSDVSGGNPGVFTNFDFYLANGNGFDLFSTANGATFVGTTTDLLGGNNGVVFTGAEAVSEYGADVPIYAPNPWEDGSSISHWALSVPSAAVMQPFFGYQEVKREYPDFELASLADIGYDIDSEPDPPTPTPGGPPTPTPEPTIDVPATGPMGIGLLIALISLMLGFTGKRKK
jgi:hypothetical protein